MNDRPFLVGFLVFLLICVVIGVVTYLRFSELGYLFTNQFFGTLVFLLVFILVIFLSILRRLVREAETSPRGKNEAL